MIANDISVVIIAMAGASYKNGLIGKRRNPVFLRKNFDHVGHNLK